MVIDIMNMDVYIKDNGIKEVSSSNIFAIKSTEPDPDGLGSYDIFGKPGSYERKHVYGYVDLGDIFVHPHVFNVLTSLKKIITDVVYGNGYFYIDKGIIKRLGEDELPPPGKEKGSGVHWFYDNWEKLNFKKDIMSPIVKDRVIFIDKLKKEEVFITKFLVSPPFYRDIDVSSNKKNEINIMYQRLISLSSVVKSSGTLMPFQTTTDAHRKIQDTLTELYNYFVTFTAGTKGFIHQHVMGKSTDYSARMVISTPTINATTPDDMEVSFSHSAVPLNIVIKCFAPYIVHELRRYVLDKLEGSKYLFRRDKKGNLERVELADHYSEELLSDNIHKIIDLYYDAKEHRLDKFTLLAEDGSRLPLVYFTKTNEVISAADDKLSKQPSIISHELTLCELFYIVAMNSVAKKAIYITRYPIEDYHNIYPSLMNIIPYNRVREAPVDGVRYPRFPVIDIEKDMPNVDTMFTDTLRIFPTYLAALGADFDGDMCSVQGVWGNDSSEDYIFSKVNIVNIAGNTMRTTKDVTAHTIFALTKKE
jgi:hypothetical protein